MTWATDHSDVIEVGTLHAFSSRLLPKNGIFIYHTYDVRRNQVKIHNRQEPDKFRTNLRHVKS